MTDYIVTLPNNVEYVGSVVKSTAYDPPNTIRMTTGNPEFPFRVIGYKNIVSINGLYSYYEAPKDEVKQVIGSDGSIYTVKSSNGVKTCSCPGFGFRKACKHLNI